MLQLRPYAVSLVCTGLAVLVILVHHVVVPVLGLDGRQAILTGLPAYALLAVAFVAWRRVPPVRWVGPKRQRGGKRRWR